MHPQKNNFDKTKLYNWKNNLKSWEVIITEIINKDLMNFFGYKLSENDYRKNLDKNLKLLIMNLSKDNKNIFLKVFF